MVAADVAAAADAAAEASRWAVAGLDARAGRLEGATARLAAAVGGQGGWL